MGMKENLNILLVEDDLINQKVAVSILKRKGHTITIADNGEIGVDYYIKNQYDVILMDIQMPVMDGIEATKTIRKKEKETGKKIIIIAVTAYSLDKDRERIMAAGMDNYLSKPYKPSDLHNIIEDTLNKKQV
jgi:CheY-like chemotaxis protein